MKTYAVRTKENNQTLTTIAVGTPEDWRETMDFLKEQGVEVQTRSFSDYTGDAIPVDQLYYFAGNPDECPVAGPAWLPWTI